MRIERIETHRLNEHDERRRDHYTWVRIFTDEGIVGTGETHSNPRGLVGAIHDYYAPILLNADPLDIAYLWAEMYTTANSSGAGGTELRALSALDIALWDILGQVTNQPVYKLLGGQCHDRVRVYNSPLNCGDMRDHDRCLAEPGEYARELLADGFTAMKVWPLDTMARLSRTRPFGDPHGSFWAWGPPSYSFEKEKLAQSMSILSAIREAVGDHIDIAVEGHGRWSLPTAVKIATAMQQYDIMFFEDAMHPDSFDDMAWLTSVSPVPICFSERLMTRYAFREALARRAMQFVMVDVCWCGGISEARNIAVMADTFHLPLTTHGAIGPFLTLASWHVCMAAPNAVIMEVVRSQMRAWYGEVITESPDAREGFLTAPTGSGLGAALRPEFLQRADLITEASTL